MRHLVILLSMITALNATAKNLFPDKDYAPLKLDFVSLENDKCDLEQELFENLNYVEIKIEDIEVIELEEEVIIDFDTKQYLPERFVAEKGMYDIDLNDIEVIELEEEVIINFDTKKYLPAGFDPHATPSKNCDSL